MDKQNSIEEEDVMTDADFERAMEQLREQGDEDVNELLMAMSENRIISWDEAERILGATSTEPIKSSLPQQTRPTEPDNDTDVEWCTQRLMQNDPKLVEINLNNMKRTPVPKIKRMIEALGNNEYLEKLSLANMGLYDLDLQPLIDILEHNEVLRCINLETNYLSGDFFARLFKAALTNQTLEEVKAVNQGVAFSTQAEREIIEAITQNRGLTKVSINLRLPEGRFKVEQATIRNQEIRRILRRQMMQAEKEKEAQQSLPPPSPKKKEPFKLPQKKEAPAEVKRAKTTHTGAAADLARRRTSSSLAIAGVNTPNPSTSDEPSTPLDKKTAVRERAREADEKAKKPFEPPKTAERAILAEKAKEGKKATGKWPPGNKASQEQAEEGKGGEQQKGEERKESGGGKPSWRDRLAQKEEEQKGEPQRKGSLALREKFEKKASVDGEEKPKGPPPPPKPRAGAGEKMVAAKGKFEQKEVKGGEKGKERPKVEQKPAQKETKAEGKGKTEKKMDGVGVDGEEKKEKEKGTTTKKVVRKKTSTDASPEKVKAGVEKKKETKQPTTTTTNQTNQGQRSFPSWRERLNQNK